MHKILSNNDKELMEKNFLIILFYTTIWLWPYIAILIIILTLLR